MKKFLLEIDTRPNTTFCLQYADDLASVATFAQNAGYRLHSVREVKTDEAQALEQSGIRYGLEGVSR